MNAISAIAAAIAAIASMVAVIISLVQQREMKMHENVKTKSEQELLWYNNVVLEDLISRLNQEVDSIETDIAACRKIEKGQTEEVLKELFDNMKSKFMILQNRMYVLVLFDKNLQINCNKKLQEIFDLYSDFINASVNVGCIQYHNIHGIQQHLIELMNMMYRKGLELTAEWD